MKVKFLGTAAAEGWPAVFCNCDACEKAWELGGKNIRTRAQVLVDDVLLIDFGPDTYHHVLKHRIRLMKVENVLVTHSHTDHWYPTELILRARPYAYGGKDNKLMIYGNSAVKKMFEHTLNVEDDSVDMPKCVGFTQVSPFVPFKIEGYTVTPLLARHDPKEECLLFLIESEDGKCLLYGNDTGVFPKETWDFLKGKHLDLVSLDCTHGRHSYPLGGHMGMADNASVKTRLIRMGCADENTRFVITHFSHNGGWLHDELVENAKVHDLIVAYDGYEIEV